jgi:hypothetical protein
MLSKSEAGYQDHAPDHRHPCVMCRHFDAYRGACALVAGSVRSRAACNHWRMVDNKKADTSS